MGCINEGAGGRGEEGGGRKPMKWCAHLTLNFHICVPSTPSASTFTTCCVHKSPLVCTAERYLPCPSEHQGRPVQHRQHLQRRELLLKPANACVRATIGWRETRPMTVSDKLWGVPESSSDSFSDCPPSAISRFSRPPFPHPTPASSLRWFCVPLCGPWRGPTIVCFYWSVSLPGAFPRVPVLLPAPFCEGTS